MSTAFNLKYQLESIHYSYTRREVRERVSLSQIGLYAIWMPSGHTGGYRCVYVGKSEECLRGRLLDHLRRSEPNPEIKRHVRLYQDILMFSIALTASVEETDGLETQVIRAWQPVANRNKRGPAT